MERKKKWKKPKKKTKTGRIRRERISSCLCMCAFLCPTHVIIWVFFCWCVDLVHLCVLSSGGYIEPTPLAIFFLFLIRTFFSGIIQQKWKCIKTWKRFDFYFLFFFYWEPKNEIEHNKMFWRLFIFLCMYSGVGCKSAAQPRRTRRTPIFEPFAAPSSPRRSNFLTFSSKSHQVCHHHHLVFMFYSWWTAVSASLPVALPFCLYFCLVWISCIWPTKSYFFFILMGRQHPRIGGNWETTNLIPIRMNWQNCIWPTG